MYALAAFWTLCSQVELDRQGIVFGGVKVFYAMKEARAVAAQERKQKAVEKAAGGERPAKRA